MKSDKESCNQGSEQTHLPVQAGLFVTDHVSSAVSPPVTVGGCFGVGQGSQDCLGFNVKKQL